MVGDIVESIFETLAWALEDERSKRPLDKVSSDYYYANKRLEELQEEISRLLPPEEQIKAKRLDDECIALLAAGAGLSYRQGLADGMRLILEALTWAPSRG